MKNLNITEFDLTADLRQRRARKLFYLSLFTAVGISLFGCSSGGSADSSAAGSDPSLEGKNLVVRLSDAPAQYDWIARTDVVVSRLDAQITTDHSSKFVTLSNTKETINLMDLRGGISKIMGALDLPSCTIDQMRLVIDSATVTLKDGRTYPLKVPSGQESGLKLFISPALEVRTGQVSELMLDFDVSRSFVLTGNPQSMAEVNGFIFKPVVRVGNSTVHGSLSGEVYGDACTPNDPSDDLPLANAVVDVMDANSQPVVSNSTISSGKYAVYGLDEGSYSLNISKAGFSAGSISGVAVYRGNNTPVERITLAQTSCGSGGTGSGTDTGTATDTATATDTSTDTSSVTDTGTATDTNTTTDTTTVTDTVVTGTGDGSGTSTSTTQNTGTDVITAWTVVGFDASTTSQSATVIWQTAVPTTAVIKVGTGIDSMQVVASVIDPATSQIITIDGLTPDTNYYLQVIATDSLGTSQESEVIIKRTKAIQ